MANAKFPTPPLEQRDGGRVEPTTPLAGNNAPLNSRRDPIHPTPGWVNRSRPHACRDTTCSRAMSASRGSPWHVQRLESRFRRPVRKSAGGGEARSDMLQHPLIGVGRPTKPQAEHGESPNVTTDTVFRTLFCFACLVGSTPGLCVPPGYSVPSLRNCSFGRVESGDAWKGARKPLS